MCYPHVYVACVNIGYNKEQYLKALQEKGIILRTGSDKKGYWKIIK